MNGVELSASVDASRLRSAIPEIVAFGRRTLVEQCVTSAAFICQRAQQLTPTTPLSRIDADMQAQYSTAVNKNGELSRNKRKQQANMSLPERGAAEMIVVARMHPNSKFNRMTGGKWLLQKPALNASKFVRAYGESGGSMAKQVFWNWVAAAAERMVRARRSSKDFLKAGWKPSIRKLFSHPDFKGNRRRGASMSGQLNALNSLSNDMGDAAVAVAVDSVLVTASNDVGEMVGNTNPILAEKHRRALIIHALPAAQTACDEEAAKIEAEVEARLAEGMVQINKQLA